jgi:phospholipid N-methyltransferase
MKFEGGKETLKLGPALADSVKERGDARDLLFAGSRLGGSARRAERSGVLLSYWRFLLASVTQLPQVGAVVPSQRFLIDRMIAPVPPSYRGQILELGAGTGALTRRLAARCPKATILACEINPMLAHDLQLSLNTRTLRRQIQVVNEPAERLLARAGDWDFPAPDYIISGIPLGNLGREPVLALIDAIHGALAPAGLYIQFQHSLLDRRKIKDTFAQLRTVSVLMNFPPAVVYYARK